MRSNEEMTSDQLACLKFERIEMTNKIESKENELKKLEEQIAWLKFKLAFNEKTIGLLQQGDE